MESYFDKRDSVVSGVDAYHKKATLTKKENYNFTKQVEKPIHYETFRDLGIVHKSRSFAFVSP